MQNIKIGENLKSEGGNQIRICPKELADMLNLPHKNEYVSEYMVELVELGLMDGFDIILDGISKNDIKKVEKIANDAKGYYNLDVTIEQ